MVSAPDEGIQSTRCCTATPMTGLGLVSRVSPVQTAVRNCTRDEGRSFEVGNQVLISSHRNPSVARSGNARVRRGMIQLAWRFLMFQKNSALAQWFQTRTKNARGTRKPMVVALARKLLIALWRFVREGVVPDGVVLRAAS